jgi:hypothetical protein
MHLVNCNKGADSNVRVTRQLPVNRTGNRDERRPKKVLDVDPGLQNPELNSLETGDAQSVARVRWAIVNEIIES